MLVPGSVTTTTADSVYFGTDTDALGSGTITVSGTVNAQDLYFGKVSGALTLSGGTIAFGAGGTSNIEASSGSGTMTATHTIDSNISKSSGIISIGRQNTTDENYIFNGVISGATVALDLRPSNNVAYIELNGANTFGGNVGLVTGQLNANTFALGASPQSLGQGNTFNMGGGGGQAPLLWYTGTAAAWTDKTFQTKATGSRIVAQDGALTLAGTVETSQAGTYNLTFSGTADTGVNTVSGTMQNGTGTLDVILANTAPQGGSGENAYWRFTGNNTYNGTTTLNNTSTLELSGNGLLGGGTYSSTLSINGGSTFHWNGDNLQVLDGVVQGSGTGGILATGAEQLRIVFSTANTTFTGPVTVDGGSLQFRNTADLQSFAASDLNIEGGGGLAIQSSVGGSNRTSLNNKTWTFDNGGGTLTFNGGSHLFQGFGTHNFNVTASGSGSTIQSINSGLMNMQGAGNIIFDVADGAADRDLELSARFDNGLITKNGAGTLAITGTHNGNYAIDINAGTLEVGDSARLAGGTFTAAITNDGIFKHTSNQLQTLSGNISGSGSLEKIGGAKLTLSGNSTYNGTTTIGDGVSAGVIQAGSNTGLSSNSAFTLNSGTTLILDGFDNTIGSLAGAGAVRNDSGASTATLTTGGDDSSTTFSGTLTDGASALALSLVKEGTGTMTITGANQQQHTGTTTVSEGTLSLASGYNHAGTGAYTVGTDGTTAILNVADGVDISGHSMTISLGGVISPGNSPGTIDTGSQTWGNGGSYLWEIDDATGSQGGDPGWDWMDITGNLTITATGGGFTIDIDSLLHSAGHSPDVSGDALNFVELNHVPEIDYSFTIATVSGSISGFSESAFTLDDSGFTNTGWLWSITADANNIYLNANFVPEPSSSALLGLGGLILAFRRKR